MAWDLEVTWVLRCPKGIDPHQHSKGFQTASTFMPGAGRWELDTHFPQKKGTTGYVVMKTPRIVTAFCVCRVKITEL
jgi:hypothetical protein